MLDDDDDVDADISESARCVVWREMGEFGKIAAVEAAEQRVLWIERIFCRYLFLSLCRRLVIIVFFSMSSGCCC